MQIEISAECFVKYSKIVEVSDADFFEYQRLIDDEFISERERTRKLEALVQKYRVASADNLVQSDELEQVTFTPVAATN